MSKEPPKRKYKKAAKRAVGRPSKYDPAVCELAYKWTKEYGVDDVGLASMMQVHIDTIYTWKKEHPEFSDAQKKGKDDYDSVGIEKSLRRRAEGYDYEERIIDYDEDGNIKSEKIMKKRMAPDPTSMIFWLKNRNPPRWRDAKHIDFENTKDSYPIEIVNAKRTDTAES